jgi:hypothetical protein
VTLRNLDVTNFYITSATNVSVLGGDVGPVTNLSAQIKASSGSTVQPSAILIDGVNFHDFNRSNTSVHMECLQVLSANNIVVRRSRFRHCAVMDVYFSQFGDAGVTRDVTLENNFLDKPTSGGFYAVDVAVQRGAAPKNFLFRNNSALDTMHVDTTAGIDNVRFIANIGVFAQYACSKGMVFEYNVWDNAKCSATDLRAPSGFKDPASLDLHLVPGAAAIDHGDKSASPTLDIDGQKRPLGRGPDAGADEAR